MELNELPEKNPKSSRITICVTDETKLKAEFLKAQKKNVPEIMRQAVENAFRDVVVPQDFVLD